MHCMSMQARVPNNHSEFIALQALEYEKQFYLWTRAGRVGCAGKTTFSGPFPSVAEVTLEFRTLFTSHTNCEWDERHTMLRYQEGKYTWIELDYSTGTPYSESLTSALTDNQGEMDNADNFRDFDHVPTSPSPLPVVSSSTRKRRRAAMRMAYASATSTTTATPTTSVQRSLSTQFDWLYANSDGDVACAASSETSTCACAIAPPSRLPAAVQDFLTLIADHAELSYTYTVTDDLLGDAIMKLPLGRLSKTTIKRVSFVVHFCWCSCANVFVVLLTGIRDFGGNLRSTAQPADVSSKTDKSEQPLLFTYSASLASRVY